MVIDYMKLYQEMFIKVWGLDNEPTPKEMKIYEKLEEWICNFYSDRYIDEEKLYE